VTEPDADRLVARLLRRELSREQIDAVDARSLPSVLHREVWFIGDAAAELAIEMSNARIMQTLYSRDNDAWRRSRGERLPDMPDVLASLRKWRALS
jgi:hypothetical protein